MVPVIGIVGATGQTGLSIVHALLAPDSPLAIPPSYIISLTRPTSASNAANTSLSALGVSIRPFSLTDPHATLVSSLSGIQILISCISGGEEQLQQIPLATAAKEASVQRFLPSAWLPVIPPGGVHIFRDLKEQVYQHVKFIGLPYTIVDVGWWYQIAFPKLPSGRADYAISLPAEEIYGTGEAPSALTDLRDVGKYVARILGDDRTINQSVLCYSEVHSQLDSYALMEKLSGEKIPRYFISQQDLEDGIAEALPILQSGGMDYRSQEGAIIAYKAVAGQYAVSWGVRGDNTPAKAKELGYLVSSELWPDFEFVKYEDFLRDVVEGRAKPVYADRRGGFMEAAAFLKKQREQQRKEKKGME